MSDLAEASSPTYEARNAFVAGTLRSLNCDPDLAKVSGTTFNSDPGRAGTGRVTAYELGRHLVISLDPEVLDVVQKVTWATPPSRTAWAAAAIEAGASEVGSAEMLTLSSAGIGDAPMPKNFQSQAFEPESSDGRSIIESLIARSSAEDIDDAEIDLENPDDFARVAIGLDDSEPLAYAGALLWRPGTHFSSGSFTADGFGDIGILVLPAARGTGVGSALVADLCRDMLASGCQPLYRRGDENLGSAGIAKRLGFVTATRLKMVRF